MIQVSALIAQALILLFFVELAQPEAYMVCEDIWRQTPDTPA